MLFCHTGTGSDVKAPKKPQRSRPSHTVNHGSHIHKRSSANQNEAGADSRQSAMNIPALKDGTTSPCNKNSPGKPNVPTDSQSTNQNDLDVEPNISANTQHTRQNNSDWDAAKPAVKNSNSHIDSALTSPQKHREKRKHCDPADSHKHKHKKRKHSKDSRFEGHRISHLVKKRTYQKANSEDNDNDEEKKSDDYVLAKLFKKSGRLFVHRSAISDMVYLKSCRNNKLLLFFRYPQCDAA